MIFPSIDLHSHSQEKVTLYAQNSSCFGAFYVSFRMTKKGVKLNWLSGHVIDINCYKSARKLAKNLLLIKE